MKKRIGVWVKISRRKGFYSGDLPGEMGGTARWCSKDEIKAVSGMALSIPMLPHSAMRISAATVSRLMRWEKGTG